MADILQGNRKEGYWITPSSGGEMPVLPISADYPRWWEQIHTLVIDGHSIIARRSTTGFLDGKPLPDRVLTVEEWKAFYCAWHNEFKADESDLLDGVYEIRRHHRQCAESHKFFCHTMLDGKIARSKGDNTVVFEEEQMHLPVLSRNDTHTAGIVRLSGQEFPVWRWEENRLWHIGKTPDASVKARYSVDATMHVKYGSKKEQAALAYLQEKGLCLSEVWQDNVRRAYVGYVSLTHEEYCQVKQLDKRLQLFEI